MASGSPGLTHPACRSRGLSRWPQTSLLCYIKSDGFSGPDRLAMKPVLYLVTTRRNGRSLLAIFSSILWYLFAREAPPSWLAVSFMLQKCFTTEHPQICAVLGFTAAVDRVIQRTY